MTTLTRGRARRLTGWFLCLLTVGALTGACGGDDDPVVETPATTLSQGGGGYYPNE